MFYNLFYKWNKVSYMEQIEKLAPALARGLKIIELVASLERAASFTEIASKTKTPKATANRLLKVLLASGYLRKSPEGAYEPGAKCNLLGIKSRLLVELERLGSEAVLALRERCANTSVLFHWNGAQTQVLAKATHESSIAMQPLGNVSCDLAGTPWGWLALAESPEGSEARRANASLVESEEFGKAMEKALTRGYLVEPSSSKGLRRLAVPVKAGGETVAFLALGGNPFTIPDSSVEEMGCALAAQAAVMEDRLAASFGASETMKESE